MCLERFQLKVERPKIIPEKSGDNPKVEKGGMDRIQIVVQLRMSAAL